MNGKEISSSRVRSVIPRLEMQTADHDKKAPRKWYQALCWRYLTFALKSGHWRLGHGAGDDIFASNCRSLSLMRHEMCDRHHLGW